jgi:hypothetical protein
LGTASAAEAVGTVGAAPKAICEHNSLAYFR